MNLLIEGSIINFGYVHMANVQENMTDVKRICVHKNQ